VGGMAFISHTEPSGPGSFLTSDLAHPVFLVSEHDRKSRYLSLYCVGLGATGHTVLVVLVL